MASQNNNDNERQARQLFVIHEDTAYNQNPKSRSNNKSIYFCVGLSALTMGLMVGFGILGAAAGPIGIFAGILAGFAIGFSIFLIKSVIDKFIEYRENSKSQARQNNKNKSPSYYDLISEKNELIDKNRHKTRNKPKKV